MPREMDYGRIEFQNYEQRFILKIFSRNPYNTSWVIKILSSYCFRFLFGSLNHHYRLHYPQYSSYVEKTSYHALIYYHFLLILIFLALLVKLACFFLKKWFKHFHFYKSKDLLSMFHCMKVSIKTGIEFAVSVKVIQ